MGKEQLGEDSFLSPENLFGIASPAFNLLFVYHNEFAGEEAIRLENSLSGK